MSSLPARWVGHQTAFTTYDPKTSEVEYELFDSHRNGP